MASSLDDASACAQGRLGMRPKKGDAVLFYDKFENGTDDQASIHAACPVIKGIKWSAPIWIHQTPFRPEELNNERYLNQKLQDPGLCSDSNQNCVEWADRGECSHNQQYMASNCRKSCGICVDCEEGDWECYLSNRERAGFLNLFDELETITGARFNSQV
eukprot:TRINITY_DN2004_c0_g1_i16.p1 TRINITY_DN2004_c0_g1~~TRINITY_DN2004_c0_g1_i16.p1  ORF type:complete len:176 (+),score=36.33 TRINITY_DN2004_c0_g1_i16:49-528(+)